MPSSTRWTPLLVTLLAACDGALPLAPPLPPSRPPASAPFAAAPPQSPCPQRPGYAPLAFSEARIERAGKRGSADATGPRFASADPELAIPVAEVQAQIDRWLRGTGGGIDDCEKGCAFHASCQVTRNDGELLGVLCENQFSYTGWREGTGHESFLFRRRGKTYSRVEPQDFARRPESSLLVRLLPTFSPETSMSVKEAEDIKGFYVALRDARFEVGPTGPNDPTGRFYPPLARVSRHLRCDTLLDMPSGPLPSAERGPLAFAAEVVEDTDPAVASAWGGAEATVETVRFVATDARHAAGAAALNRAVSGWVEALRGRVQAEGWRLVSATCRATASTDALASVLCYAGGHTEEGETRVSRGSITLRLGAAPARVEAAEILGRRPGAPAEITRRCLGHLVRPPTDAGDEVLSALPALGAADLADFAVTRSGIVFDIEYDLAGQRRLMPCHVPHEALGTSYEAIAKGP